MVQLQSAPLMVLDLDVPFAEMLSIGATPAGRRRIAAIAGGSFSGDRLRGMVLPGGADWVLNRADGVMLIDVRLALLTDDGARLYLSYQGSFRAPEDVMARFNRGERLGDDEYRLRTVARFEAGAEAYRWLNDTIVVGIGHQRAGGPRYHLFEIL